jgi:hypothetical protein
VIHTTAEQESLLREQEIRKLLSEAFHVAAIARDVERPTRIRLGKGSSIEEMTPRELLTRYFEARELGSERIGVLTRYADAIFNSDVESSAGVGQEGDAQ